MTLSPGNAALQTALSTALGAIARLDAVGTTVTRIDIRGGTPVLHVDRAPDSICSSVRMSRPFGMRRLIIHAAPFDGAQLEWTENIPRKVRA